MAAASAPAVQSGAGTVPLAAVAPNPLNARRQFGDVTGLAESISDKGLLQPCVVVTRAAYQALYPEHIDETAAASYVAVSGHRRLAAAEAAGSDTIDVVVRDELAASRKTFVSAALDENVHHEPLDVFDEADALEGLVDLYGTQVALAAERGYTQGWISQRLTLRNLIAELREAVRAKRLSIEVARKLARKSPEEQREIWQAKYNGAGEDNQVLRRNTEEDIRAAAERAVRSLTRTLAGLDQTVRTETLASVAREQLTDEERRQLLDLLTKDSDAEPTEDGITP